MSCKLEPAIWSRDTGQRIPCFDRCQLIIVWIFNINEVRGKPRLCLFWSMAAIGRHVGQQQIDVSFLCVCPVIDHEFRHHIVKVAVDPRGDSRMDPQTTLTML